jgi:hypothetical protein
MLAPDRITVHAHDTRTNCVYDLDGHPSQVSVGALLQTIELAATRFGLVAHARRRTGSPDEHPIFDIVLRQQAAAREDPLVEYIRERRVHRRPLRLRRLSVDEKEALTRAVEPDFRVVWFESWSDRAKVAMLNFASAKIRLMLREAYAVHREVIEWNSRFSERGIPDAALGASAPLLTLMRWAMASWERIDFLNRYLAGTLAPRIELDLVPGLACAAHCVIAAQSAPVTLEDYIAVGRAVQRFWLSATRLGLQFQPEYTPLIFARYARDAIRFSTNEQAMHRAASIGTKLDTLLGSALARRAAFMGRIGAGQPADARSLRLPLDLLLLPDSGQRS